MPSYAIIGPDPSEKEDDTSYGPSNYGKPGPHRFIGIGMVAGMIFLALAAYFAFGRWPKRMRRKYCRCLGDRGSDEAVDGEERTMKRVAVILETTSSASTSSSEEKTHHHSQSGNSIRVSHSRTDSDPKSKSRKQSSCSRNRSKHGRGTRIADGTMVHDVDREPGNLVTGWEVEHIGGVRYEVSCSRPELF